MCVHEASVTPATFPRFDNITSKRNADLSRDKRHLVVIKPDLPNGLRTVTVQVVDLQDPLLSSKSYDIVLDVSDNNDPPVMASFSIDVSEGTAAGTALTAMVGSDVDPNQNLDYSVTNREDFDNYFNTEALLGPQPAKASLVGLMRSANLLLRQDFLDYETRQTYEVEVKVEDDGRVNDYQQAEDGSAAYAFVTKQSVLATITINVLDVPDVPVIDTISIRSSFGLTTAGGEEVTLVGSHFGPALPASPGGVIDINAEYSNENKTLFVDDCAIVEAYTKIVCKSLPGFGYDFRWRVQVGGQWSAWSADTTFYAKPNIASFDEEGAQGAITSGNQTVVLVGTQFGTITDNAITSVTYGPSGFEYVAKDCHVIQDHTKIQCLTAPGIGNALLWVVEVGFQASVTPTTSYAPPVIDTVVGPAKFRTNGGELVTLRGSNFGATTEVESIDWVMYGHVEDKSRSTWYTATNCRVSVDHVEVQCNSVSGVSTGLFWVISIKGQASLLSPTSTDYGAPHIDTVTLVQPEGGAPTKGGVRVTILGSNFGSAGDERQVSFGTVFPKLASVVYVSHEELQFTLPAGTGVNKAISIRVAEQVSNEVFFSYDAPEVTTMQHITGSPPAPINVTVLGANFGQCCFLNRTDTTPGAKHECDCDAGLEVVLVNGTACADLRYLSDDQVTCVTRETGGVVTVSSGGRTSPDFPYSYVKFLATPFITDITFSAAPTTAGAVTAYVDGGSFGEEGVVYFRTAVGFAKLAPLGYSGTAISFLLPEGQGDAEVKIAVMGETRLSAPDTIQYAKPVVSLVENWRGTTAGDAVLRISGLHFGMPAYRYIAALGPVDELIHNQVLVGDRECAILSYSHTTIECRAPAGSGTNKTVQVRVGRHCVDDCSPPYTAATAAQNFHYDPPVVTSIVPNHGPTAGGTLIEITGTSFGDNTVPVQVTIGGTEVNRLEHHSHTSIKFRMHKGIGARLDVELEVDGQSVLVPRGFSYDPPVVTSVVSRVDRARGVYGICPSGSTCLNRTFDAFQSQLVIDGYNFGGDAPDPTTTSVRVGNAPCTIPAGATSIWVSDTRIECDVTALTVGPKYVNVTIARQFTVVPASHNLTAECKENFYGTVGEVCQQCPLEGAFCGGKGLEPMAIQGYWKFNRTGFVKCGPPSACQADNVCSDGYREAGCTACVPKQYYRDLFTGLCEPCPSMAYMLLLAYAGGGILIGAIFYKLYKKGPSVAAVGIAIDYFQILSIFADLNLGWPETIVTVFEYASVTAANVEMTSPECSVSATYTEKWFFIQTVPFQMAFGLVVLHFLIVLRKVVCCKRGSRTKHVATMLGMYIVSLNYLFLFLTRKGFEALNCTRLSEGGPLFLVADPAVSCETESYQVLRTSAILSILVYGAGIPVLYAVLIFGNRGAIKVDQALRIRGLAGSRNSNPYYDMQKRLRRLYFKFRPECYFWMLCILMRKFVIVVLSAEAAGKPMFAASSTVLLLFAAYALQMKYNPYRVHDPDKKDPMLDKLCGQVCCCCRLVLLLLGVVQSPVTPLFFVSHWACAGH